MSRTAFFPHAPSFDSAPRQHQHQSTVQPGMKLGAGTAKVAQTHSWMTPTMARNMSPRAVRLMRADY